MAECQVLFHVQEEVSAKRREHMACPQSCTNSSESPDINCKRVDMKKEVCHKEHTGENANRA